MVQSWLRGAYAGAIAQWRGYTSAVLEEESAWRLGVATGHVQMLLDAMTHWRVQEVHGMQEYANVQAASDAYGRGMQVHGTNFYF